MIKKVIKRSDKTNKSNNNKIDRRQQFHVLNYTGPIQIIDLH